MERLGAFGSAARRAGGWRRSIAVIIALAVLLPFALSIVMQLATLFDR